MDQQNLSAPDPAQQPRILSAALLTPGQLAGVDCIHCAQPADEAVPVGHVDGGQVFACRTCHRAPACMHCGNQGPEPLLLALGKGKHACAPQCPPAYRASTR